MVLQVINNLIHQDQTLVLSTVFEGWPVELLEYCIAVTLLSWL